MPTCKRSQPLCVVREHNADYMGAVLALQTDKNALDSVKNYPVKKIGCSQMIQRMAKFTHTQCWQAPILPSVAQAHHEGRVSITYEKIVKNISLVAVCSCSTLLGENASEGAKSDIGNAEIQPRYIRCRDVACKIRARKRVGKGYSDYWERIQ